MDDVQAAYDAYNAINEATDKDAQVCLRRLCNMNPYTGERVNSNLSFIIRHQKEAFVSLIALVHGSSGAKRLAAQFIPKFFKYFPSLSEKAIDALLDLCEDEELVVSVNTSFILPIGLFASPPKLKLRYIVYIFSEPGT